MLQYGPAYWIEALQLQRYPGGGYFREVYRSSEQIPAAALPPRFSAEHSISTAIYFLLVHPQYDPLHRLMADEIWHFYAGSPLHLHLFYPTGQYSLARLGADPACGQAFQVVVPAGYWFAAEVAEPQGYTLAGCTVAPGFDPADFMAADSQEMFTKYPAQRELIARLLA